MDLSEELLVSGVVPFTDNFSDLSNTNGFQFEFRCERCGNGYRSGYQRDVVTTGQGILRSVGSLFGGVLQNVGNAADEMVLNRGTNSAAKDRALAKAVEEIAPKFVQCRGCGNWACREVCWNEQAGQCVSCSPLVDDELGRLRAEARTQQLQDKLAATDLVSGINVTQERASGCPSCGARTNPGAKFCAECGTAFKTTLTCSSCDAELSAGSRFCSECGAKVA